MRKSPKVMPEHNPHILGASELANRQDLDQVSTFSEILDSLKNYPPEHDRELCTMYTISRQNKNISYMAPLGPSQVDIGNLNSCSCQRMSDEGHYKVSRYTHIFSIVQSIENLFLGHEV